MPDIDAGPISIVQLLMLRDERSSQELGAVLWAAFKEVEAFYNADRPRAVFRRANGSPYVPDSIRQEDSSGLSQRFASMDKKTLWKETQGRSSRTVEHSKVSRLVRSVVGLDADTRHVIVIDQELTPPPKWRYVIFDGDSDGAVISIVPTDPEYWSERDADRAGTIKHRVRTACLTIVGALLGLNRCDNPRCFLYEDIDAVTALDSMVVLGDEHEIPALAGRGFRIHTPDPRAIQLIETGLEALESA